METRGWLLTAMAALLLALLIFLAGRWQERASATSERDALRAEIATLSADRDRVRDELAAAQDRIALLHARSLVFETALDLERRNFGTANTRLDETERLLASVRDASALPRLEALRSEIAGTDLRVASDLARQREMVLGFAAALDSIISRAPAAAGNP